LQGLGKRKVLPACIASLSGKVKTRVSFGLMQRKSLAAIPFKLFTDARLRGNREAIVKVILLSVTFK
jgi:hypothetical protein